MKKLKVLCVLDSQPNDFNLIGPFPSWLFFILKSENYLKEACEVIKKSDDLHWLKEITPDSFNEKLLFKNNRFLIEIRDAIEIEGKIYTDLPNRIFVKRFGYKPKR